MDDGPPAESWLAFHWGEAHRPRSYERILAGFSGARLWKLDTPSGPFALRAWPEGQPDPERLMWIHARQTELRDAGLTWVPAPIPTVRGTTFTRTRDDLWELAPWLPGAIVPPAQATAVQRANACRETARMHACTPERATTGRSASLKRRAALAERASSIKGKALLQAALKSSDASLAKMAEACAAVPDARLVEVCEALVAASAQRLRLLPCLRDLRSDHVLFVGEQVVGIVDWGSLFDDSPAIDLARLLGDFLPMGGWSAEVAAYEEVHPLDPVERSLLPLLHMAAVLLSPWQWLEWLVGEQRTFPDHLAVSGRLDELTRQLNAFPFGGPTARGALRRPLID